MMMMQMRRARAIAAQNPHRKALILPIVTLIGATAMEPAGHSGASQRMGKMVPLGNI